MTTAHAPDVGPIVPRLVIVVRIGAAADVGSVGGASVRATSVVVVAAGVALVHVDGGVGFLIMGGHGEGGLIGVDVVGVGELTVVVAGEVAVEFPVVVGKEADDDGEDPEEAVEMENVSLI